MKITLPASQAKKAAVLESLVSNPRPRKQLEKRGVVTTPEEQSEVVTLKGLAFGHFQQTWQSQGFKVGQKRAAFTAFKSLAFRENI